MNMRTQIMNKLLLADLYNWFSDCQLKWSKLEVNFSFHSKASPKILKTISWSFLRDHNNWSRFRKSIRTSSWQKYIQLLVSHFFSLVIYVSPSFVAFVEKLCYWKKGKSFWKLYCFKSQNSNSIFDFVTDSFLF
jgi:hypothetical protein